MRLKFSNRFEFKYLLSREQQEGVVQTLTGQVEPDTHNQGQPYQVTSLYYDTADYKAYRDKMEGHRFRRKVRIRVYNAQTVNPETRCFVEIKQHINKTISKKRVILPYAAAAALCGAGEDVEGESEADRTVIQEVQYLYHVLQLRPACVISYNRLAFNGTEYDPGLRVTFDTFLKSRVRDLSLLSQGFADNQFFLPPDQAVMEVKVNYRTPYWLVQLIGEHRCSLRSVSKYCVALERSKALLKHRQVIPLRPEEKSHGRYNQLIF